MGIAMAALGVSAVIILEIGLAIAVTAIITPLIFAIPVIAMVAALARSAVIHLGAAVALVHPGVASARIGHQW